MLFNRRMKERTAAELRLKEKAEAAAKAAKEKEQYSTIASKNSRNVAVIRTGTSVRSGQYSKSSKSLVV